MAKRFKDKKAKDLGEGVFKAEASTDVFGGSIGKDELQAKGVEGNWDKVQELGASSETHLEDDKGEGHAVVMRQFVFGINPQAFMEVKPTKQQIFNSHLKGIEISLWKDGLQVWDAVEPRIHLDAQNMRYTIYVGAITSKGNRFSTLHKPKKLTELLHGGRAS